MTVLKCCGDSVGRLGPVRDIQAVASERLTDGVGESVFCEKRQKQLVGQSDCKGEEGGSLSSRCNHSLVCGRRSKQARVEGHESSESRSLSFVCVVWMFVKHVGKFRLIRRERPRSDTPWATWWS